MSQLSIGALNALELIQEARHEYNLSKSSKKLHDEHITYDLLPAVLESMGMVRRCVNQAESDLQGKLVDTVWTTLQGDRRKYIHQEDLRIFL